MRALVLLCTLLTAMLAGCGDDVAPTRGAGAPPPPGPGNGGNLGAPPDAGTDSGTVIAILDYHDEDFVESPQNRDPFRSFARLFKVRPPDAPQRRVIMPTTGLDEMTLIAIVSGTAEPKAMFTDPIGVGYTVARGDYVGRPEVVQTGGDQGMAVTLNWRVDRIRPDSVVLIREDPTAPGNPPLTRVIPLHSENEQSAPAGSGGQGLHVTPGPGAMPSDPRYDDVQGDLVPGWDRNPLPRTEVRAR